MLYGARSAPVTPASTTRLSTLLHDAGVSVALWSGAPGTQASSDGLQRKRRRVVGSWLERGGALALQSITTVTLPFLQS